LSITRDERRGSIALAMQAISLLDITLAHATQAVSMRAT
jgi:hypothetical protein